MKGSRLHIDMFKVFQDLVATKSFSGAAEINFITQSAVSQQISVLEEYFGKTLIIRGKGKFALTQEGEIFLKGCKQILETYQLTRDQMETEPGVIAQTVNIESVYSIGFYHLPPLIKSFMKKYKQTNLHIEYNRSDKIYTNVIHGLCDFGIVAYPWPHPLVDIQFTKNENLVFVCSPKHKLSKKKKISFNNLNNMNFIAFIKEIPTRGAIDTILKKYNVYVKTVKEFDNVETLKQTLELGDSVSILPENTVQQEIKKKSLVSIPIMEGPFSRETGIITRKDRYLSKITQKAIQWIAGKK
ncbi:MAG: LysR family transcriptional regulator [Candidatus Marinimicrobia bacterium]|nr:LysR family transcriptional regulator [Candidatus Neomarinimicrobiota bacterium]MDP6260638.1 LysR family transcriptional regulator [Candidatus Neomarinimicrobiota bacterium]|tara:strand:- start:1169 stop:2065 length:897 start_codon:yes stop_codon:yes gene_type:complete